MLSRSAMADSVTPWTCSTPGSSVHGILQARTLQWIAFPNPETEPASLVSPALQADPL